MHPSQTSRGHGEAKRESVPGRTPNPYEAPSCQGTNSPRERIFCFFFRLFGPGVVSSRSRVLTGFPCTGANPAGLHHTRIEAPSPSRWRVQSAIRVVLCGLETSRDPHTVLLPRGAPWSCASEGQVRVKGQHTATLSDSRRLYRSGGGVQSNAQGQDKAPRCSWAFGDAVDASLQSTASG